MHASFTLPGNPILGHKKHVICRNHSHHNNGIKIYSTLYVLRYHHVVILLECGTHQFHQMHLEIATYFPFLKKSQTCATVAYNNATHLVGDILYC